MTRRCPCWIHLVVGLVALLLLVEGAFGSVAVGAAKVNITPNQPLAMLGYGGRDQPFEGVAQPIWARAMAIGRDAAPGPAVVVSVDTCALPMKLVENAAKRIENKTGLPRRRLTITCTHTHASPAVEGTLAPMLLRWTNEAQRQAVARYTARVTEAIVQSVIQALEQRRPTHFAWGQSQVDFAHNRRVLKDGQWAGFGVREDGPVDHDMPALVAHNEAGEVVATMVTYAAHATTMNGSFMRIHGEWPGFAAKIIEKRHPEAVALVTPGCAGDQNPQPQGDTHKQMLNNARDHGKAIADALDRILESEMTKLNGPPTCRLRRLQLPYADVPPRRVWEQRAEQEGLTAAWARTVLGRHGPDEPLPRALEDYPVQTWVFDGELAMVFLGGEALVSYSLRLKEAVPKQRLWVASYANGVPCYIPTRTALKQGGYEVDTSMKWYGRPARFEPIIEDRIISTVKSMLPKEYFKR